MAFYRCESSGGTDLDNGVVLWENPNGGTSQYKDNTTISLNDSLFNYSYIKVEYRATTTDATSLGPVFVASDQFINYGGVSILVNGSKIAGTSGSIYFREITNRSTSAGDQLNIGVCRYITGNSSNQQPTKLIPMKITGIK